MNPIDKFRLGNTPINHSQGSEKTEEELLEEIPKRLLEDWKSYTSKSPSSRREYLNRQYRVYLEESENDKVSGTYQSVLSRRIPQISTPLSTLNASATTPLAMSFSGNDLLTIVGDLAWISPFGPFIVAGIDFIKILTGKSKDAVCGDNGSLKIFKDGITAILDQLDKNRSNQKLAKIETRAKELRTKYIQGLQDVIKHDQVLSYTNSWENEINTIVIELEDIINEIKREDELQLEKSPTDRTWRWCYEIPEFQRAELKFNLLVSACILLLGYRNLSHKLGLIRQPSFDQINNETFQLLKGSFNEVIQTVAYALKAVTYRLKSSLQKSPRYTNDFVFVEKNKLKKGFQTSLTDGEVTYSIGQSIILRVMSRETFNYMQNHSIGLFEYKERFFSEIPCVVKKQYPVYIISDCLNGWQVCYYNATFVSNDNGVEWSTGPDFAENFDPTNANSHADYIMKNIRRPAIDKKIQELQTLAASLNKFGEQINFWNDQMVPKIPSTPLTIGDFSKKASDSDSAYWKRPQVSVGYGVEYMNAIGKASPIKWSITVACNGYANPKLSHIPPPAEAENTRVAVIRIHRKFEQLDKKEPINTEIIAVLKRSKPGGKFPTELLDDHDPKPRSKL